MPKLKKTIVLDEELIEWVKRNIKENEFGSLSHAIAKALTRLKAEYEGARTLSKEDRELCEKCAEKLGVSLHEFVSEAIKNQVDQMERKVVAK